MKEGAMEGEGFGKHRQYIFITHVLSFFFIFMLLVVIYKSPPADNYEVSIYAAYPFYFWILFLLADVLAIINLIFSSFYNMDNEWKISLIIIIWINSIFLLLPLFRGYYIYGRWDTLTHLGRIKDILVSGHMGKSNFYPLEHLLGAFLIQLAEIKIAKIPILFSILFSDTFILSSLLLGKLIARHRGQIILIVSFASPLIFSFYHVNIHPSIFSVFLIPYLLWFYYKGIFSLGMKIGFILILISIFLFHPITASYIGVIFGVLALAEFVYLKNPKSCNKEVMERYFQTTKKILIFYLAIFVIFFIIISSFPMIQHNLNKIMGKSLIKTKVSLAQSANLSLSQSIWIIFNRYGSVFLLFLLSILSLIYIVKLHFSRTVINAVYFLFAWQFIVAFLLGMIELFGYVMESSIIRCMRLSIVMSIFLNGLVIHTFIKKSGKQQFKYLLVLSIIVILISMISFGNVYNSPRVAKPNEQVTIKELSGVLWFEEKKTNNKPLVVNSAERWSRFIDYLFGVDYLTIKKSPIYPIRLPSHFGYAKNIYTVGDIFSHDVYMVFSYFDEKVFLSFPPSVREKCYQWNQADITHLQCDKSANRIYENMELEVWTVYGNK